MPGKTNGTSPYGSADASRRRKKPEDYGDELIAEYEAEHGPIPQALLDEFDALCNR